jgi:ATP-dependent DNA helicase RecG
MNGFMPLSIHPSSDHLSSVSMRPDSLYFLFSPITRIKGVGPSTAKDLVRLLPPMTAREENAVPRVRDLLFHLPVGIVDRRFTCPLREAKDGVVATFVVQVDDHLPPKRRGKSPYKVSCSNETGDITLIFFHAGEDYLLKALPIGQRRVISGKVEHYEFQLQMTHPEVIAPVEQLAEVQKVEPVYPLTVGLTSRRIHKIVSDALSTLPVLEEWMDKDTITRHNWPDFKKALLQAHNPREELDLSPLSPARVRLAYDEVFANQLHLAQLRKNMQRQAGEKITGTGVLTEALKKSLPYKLTSGQEQAVKEISADLASGHRMGRLLQGDVGSGKTIVALLAMLRAVEQGLQAALMVPTELIAQQHYEVITSLLGTQHSALVTIVLLTGSVKGGARETVLSDIAGGKANIIIGTHALFQEKVAFKNLAFIVVDEQHRFGVEQRMALSAKGNVPHILHMTATPIPRSLVMTLYGDMDSSLLREKPAGRKPIITRAIPFARYEDVLDRLKAALDRGEKAYWICPLIESGEDSDTDLAAAKLRFTEFKARFGNRVGLIHGRMKKDARDAEMAKFVSGKTTLLVATTVVEVGVDVRDATIMVIEQAERFGLSQLHQLRGRVGRGEKPSACALLYNEYAVMRPSLLEDEIPAATRLAILCETEDGFKIAEEDLKLRGGGDLLGTRQSGATRFVFTDMQHHLPLLFHANEQANILINKGLSESHHVLLQLFGWE